MPDTLSIIVPTRNRLGELKKQTAHLKALCEAHSGIEIIYVDGGSSDGSREFLLGTGFELLLESRANGLVKALNKGIKVASGDYVMYFNDDAYFAKADIAGALRILREEPSVGILALYHSFYGDRGVWSRVVEGGTTYKIMHYDGIPFANFGMARRETFERFGYFDERYAFMAFDPDFSLRLWEAGLEVRPYDGILIDHPGQDDLGRGAKDNALRDQIWQTRKHDVKRIMKEAFRIEAKQPGNNV